MHPRGLLLLLWSLLLRTRVVFELCKGNRKFMDKGNRHSRAYKLEHLRTTPISGFLVDTVAQI
jgi:hypothetical protein